MKQRRRGLVVPPRLAVSASLIAVTTAGCPGPAGNDGGDVVVTDQSQADQSQGDGTVMDALADVLGDAGADTAADCNPMPYTPGYFECFPDPAADAGGSCSTAGPAIVCRAGDCPRGCRACPTSSGYTGYMCLRARDAGAGTACPGSRVCTADECPAGCPPCNSPLFCIPDPDSDARVMNCDPAFACDPTGCGPGCRAVG